jgi:hypothetical protein
MRGLMRVPYQSLCLLALRGRKSLRGKALPSPEEALHALRRLTGQDFGYDAGRWGAWLRNNRKAVPRGRGQEGAWRETT